MVMPGGLPKEQKAEFDHAVAAFSGEEPIRVSAEKLSAYRDHTRGIGVPPAERFRWLAITLEHKRFANGWDGLRAIYQAAAAANPADPFVLHSWGISASDWAYTYHAHSPASAEKQTIAREAERVLLAALELAPRESRMAHTLGLVYYHHPRWAEDPEGYRSRALDWFSRAVEWDANNAIAQLYVAHCHDERKDWPRAIAEYEKVDLDRLARDWPAWRAVKCREQLAYCHACAGHTAEAIRLFSAFLDAAESLDEKQAEESIVNLHELVDAVTHKLAHPELLRRTRELVKRLAKDPRMCWLEDRYQHLFVP